MDDKVAETDTVAARLWSRDDAVFGEGSYICQFGA